MTLSIPQAALGALETLEAAGYESWAVGGCVRDSLLGREPHDWDLCTAARPEETERVFAGARVLETGRKHGTVTLLTADGPLEITTFRTEGAYSDRRRPDRVEFVSDIRQDLARRDFTVNAMAWSPRRGLLDPFGGEADLRAGRIRCVGEADARFREDALRLLRALRFAARYGFTVEPETAAALRRNRALLGAVSAERVFAELTGILCASGTGEALLTFPEVFFQILPELAPLYGFEQHRPRAHLWDVWGHTARAVDAVAPEPVLRLTMLFHDCGKPRTFTLGENGKGRFYGHPAVSAELADGALRRLRCDTLTRETVCLLVENHEMRTGHGKNDLRRLLSRLGEENMRRLLQVRRADALAHAPETRDRLLAMAAEDEALLEALLREEGRLTAGELALGGADLLALGMTPGPPVGALLRRLLERVLDGELPNDRAALLAAARRELEQKKEEKP